MPNLIEIWYGIVSWYPGGAAQFWWEMEEGGMGRNEVDGMEELGSWGNIW